MSNRILSYRGLLEDTDMETILLSTKKGEIGYRIITFKLFPNVPNVNQSSLVSIFKTEQTSAATTANFSSQNLLGTGLYVAKESTFTADETVSFDQEIFNQDIYISHRSSQGGNAINYYIELEQVKLDLSEATVATLKDMRGTE